MISDWVTKYTHTQQHDSTNLENCRSVVSPYCFNVNTTVFKISSDVHCAHMNNAKDHTIIRLHL